MDTHQKTTTQKERKGEEKKLLRKLGKAKEGFGEGGSRTLCLSQADELCFEVLSERSTDELHPQISLIAAAKINIYKVQDFVHISKRIILRLLSPAPRSFALCLPRWLFPKPQR